jgi:serine/threonine protein kinase
MAGDVLPDDLDFDQTIQIPRFGPGQKIFRRYTLQKILGRGGMGVVWLARDEQLESLVAIKLLPETLCHDQASLEALKRETKLGLHLAHPNIVRIYDFQRDDDAAAISMEYVDGPTFSDVRLTKPQQVFNPPELLGYVEALCDALNYAHTRRKIVHRDLKPRNLMLNSEGELKIADFGISRSISESMIMVTGKLGSTGSPPYISPQQWDGDPPTALDDVYSAGATLYELLSSKPPLLGVVDWQQVHSKIPPPIWKRRLELGITDVPAVPTAWEETIAACLAKNPQDRPQTIRELHTRLASNGATAVAPVEPATATPVELVPEPAEAPGGVEDFDDSFLNEMTLRDVSGGTEVIDRTPSETKVEVPGTPAISPDLTPPVPETLPTDVGETLPAEPEPPPIPSIAQEPAAPVAQPMHTIEPVALAPVISEPKVEVPVAPPPAEPEPEPPSIPSVAQEPATSVTQPTRTIAPVAFAPAISEPKVEESAAPVVDTNVTEPPAVLTDRRDEPAAAQVSSQELELEEMPSRVAGPSDIEAVQEQPATPLAQLPSSAVAPTSAEEIIAPPPEPWSPVTETEEPDRLDTATSPLRRIPRWVWLTGAAAALFLLGIPLLWKKPVGSERPTSNLGNAETHPSSTPFISGVASPLPTPYVRTEVTEPKETAAVPPAAISSASVIAAKDAPPPPNQPVISGVQETPAASSSSAVITTPQETSSSADQFAVGNAPTRPSPPTAASAAKEVPPTPNPSPRVTAAEAAPPTPIPSATVAAAETVSPPVQATPAASPEAKPKKRETVAKRPERKSTGESQSTRSNTTPAPRAASPAPTKKPARKGPAPQPFDGGVPGG